MDVIFDENDLKVIEILKQHGDYTIREIAKKAFLPITTVHNRIKKLKREGAIKRFTVELDYNKINKGFVAYVLVFVNLALLKQKHKSQYDLADELRKFHFVERVDIVAGGADLVVVIRVKDVEEFNRVLLGKLQLVEGIDKTQSLIVLHEKQSF